MNLQDSLNECYSFIEHIAKKSGQQSFLWDVQRLKTSDIKHWGWFWNNAICPWPGAIRVSNKWMGYGVMLRSAILIHEVVHLKQWDVGQLTHFNYFFKKKSIEAQAEAREGFFLAVAQKVIQ